ncbi:MAG: hypothetical protein M3Q07_26460 [Pseudobdellovibrionaceae bacterium]|nr:hypothetical protein [Pseudobdellovibrionaceae bacterium]
MSNDRMTVDVPGRLRNTSLAVSHAFMPLFDAILNSIHSIEESGREDGYIRIEIIRDDSQKLAIQSELDLRSIAGFRIEDNGTGFTRSNYKSFLTSDSSHKKSIGGKGVGRFLWLKAFAGVEIESFFVEDDKLFRRHFFFEPIPEGIREHSLQEIDASKDTRTIVTLKNYKTEYQNKASANIEIIANKIIEHSLSLFVTNSAPRIELFDSKTHLNLKEVFEDFAAQNAIFVDFSVNNEPFQLVHLKSYSNKDVGNRIHLCAHRRVVLSRQLDKYIPDVGAKIPDESGTNFYSCSYLTGKYLDEQVNQERTNFEFTTFGADGESLFTPTVQDKELMSAVSSEIWKILSAYLTPIREAKRTRINSFVQHSAPEFRPVVKHFPEVLDSIGAELSDDDLRLALYEAHYSKDLALKKKSQDLLTDTKDTEEYRKDLKEFLEKENDFGRATLVHYVVHRKVILNLLIKAIQRNSVTGSHDLESAVHQIIFPMNSSSDDFSSVNQNLWIIDERLTYHRYLASDKRMDRYDAVDIESTKRPDIAIFNQPAAFSETDTGMSSIVLVEFKKPGRSQYNEENNPIAQIINYIKLIRAGKAEDKQGLSIPVGEHVTFYCYILCDLTPKLRELIMDDSMFNPTQDNDGYFGYHKNHKAYIEIISYRKMLADAEKRNRVLFDKLGIF